MSPLAGITVHVVPNHFAGRRVIPVPAIVESAAHIAGFGNALRLLVNRPSEGRTLQFEIDARFEANAINELPIVSSSVWARDAELWITGADHDGHAIVAGLDAGGTIESQLPVPGPIPIRWPVIGGRSELLIVWQTDARSLEIAGVDRNGLSNHHAVATADVPVALTIADDRVLAVWSTRDGVQGIRTNADIKSFSLDTGYPGDLAIGQCAGSPHLAWLAGDRIFGASLGASDVQLGAPQAVEPADAAGGTMAVVSGPVPLVWCQRMLDHDETVLWVSSICVPGKDPLILEGLVHAVSWWGETLVVVGTSDIHFFQYTDAEAAG